MPIAAVAAIAAGSIGAAAIGAHAAGSAADAQSQAAQQAAELQHEDAQAALAYQKQKDLLAQQNMAPWLQAGSSGLANLSYLLGINPQSFASTPEPGVNLTGGTVGLPGLASVPPGNTSSQGPTPFLQRGPGVSALSGIGAGQPSPLTRFGEDFGNFQGTRLNALMNRTRNQATTASTPTLQSLINPALGARGSLLAPFTEKFVAPTAATEQNDPGYQFRLLQGQKALERSAAARGGLLTGGTAAAEGRYAQDYASNEYGNVYGRAFNEYSNRYNIFKQNQQDIFNKLAAMSGVGQTAAGQLGYLGQSSAGNIGNILMSSGQQIGNSLQNAAAATASGYVGGANAWGGALNNLTQLPWLYQLMSQNQGNIGGGGYMA